MSFKQIQIEYQDRDFGRESNKTFCLIFEDIGRVWLPKKCCDIDQTNNILTAPEWLLKNEGLID
ncbi:MAG: hypothetical protein CMC15_18615 [Flavobacteriaceae bacterium]|nr:hypothetical protein [Flavobacteriaceae bacterium]|tara:strand:- start:257 stop:448 length:192 start_codon:yes stop_codon:yes gene_type:complete